MLASEFMFNCLHYLEKAKALPSPITAEGEYVQVACKHNLCEHVYAANNPLVYLHSG